MRENTTNLADEVLREVTELVWSWDVRVRKKVLPLVLWLVAVAKEELEQVEQAYPVQPLYSTLTRRSDSLNRELHCILTVTSA